MKHEKKAKTGEERQKTTWHTCDFCNESLVYSVGKRGVENCIVGRSEAGGYVCSACLPGSIKTYAEIAKDFYRRHRSDAWGAALRASREIRGKEDVSDLLTLLRGVAGKIERVGMSLPYNPGDKLEGSDHDVPTTRDLDGEKIKQLEAMAANRERFI